MILNVILKAAQELPLETKDSFKYYPIGFRDEKTVPPKLLALKEQAFVRFQDHQQAQRPVVRHRKDGGIQIKVLCQIKGSLWFVVPYLWVLPTFLSRMEKVVFIIETGKGNYSCFSEMAPGIAVVSDTLEELKRETEKATAKHLELGEDIPKALQGTYELEFVFD